MDRQKENIESLRERMARDAKIVKENLAKWIAWQNGPLPAGLNTSDRQFLGPYNEINAALLDTAIDRMLLLLGGEDTKEFLLKAYQRRLAVYRKTLV